MRRLFRHLSVLSNFFLNRIRNLQFVSAHLIVMISTFLIIPLILNSYGVKYLGLFSLLLSLNVIIPNLDFGHANTISTEIGQAWGNKTPYNPRENLGTQLLIIPGITILALSTLALFNIRKIYYFIEGILSISQTRAIIFVITIHAFMLLVFNYSYKIRLALNLYKLSSKILIINSITIFFCSAISIWMRVPFAYFVVVFLASSWPVNLFYLKSTFESLLAQFKQNQISSSYENVTRVRYSSVNLTFFIAQLSTIIAFQLDNFIVAKYLSLDNVAVYSTAIKFVSLPISIFASYSLPLWTETSRSAFGDDAAQIFENLSRIVKKRLSISIPLAILVFLVLPELLKFWSVSKLQISPQFTFFLVCWLITAVMTQPIAMVTNGMLFQKFIVLSGAIGACFNILISIFFCKYFNLISGPVIGSIVSQIVTSLIPFLYIKRRFTKHD